MKNVAHESYEVCKSYVIIKYSTASIIQQLGKFRIVEKSLLNIPTHHPKYIPSIQLAGKLFDRIGCTDKF